MTESEFWARLELRICHELSGLKDPRRYMWCDGLTPEVYAFDALPPYIAGVAWFGQSGQEQWTFRLMLPSGPRSRVEIEWSALLPPEGVTWWLTLQSDERMLVIAPGDGTPDGS